MSLTARHVRTCDWREPLAVANGLRDHGGLLALLSDGGVLGRRSFVAADPDRVHVGALENSGHLNALRDPEFTNGVVGLIAYDAGARPATGVRPSDWPDLMMARYPSILVFDHEAGTVAAVGRGGNAAQAALACDRAAGWLERATTPDKTSAPALTFETENEPNVYKAAVADVVDRIAAGELFQANIARAWSGELKPDADPFEVLLRLAGREAAFGAYWRIGDRAIVSNSPELFLTFDPADGRIETRPIKGTRARNSDPARDAALARDLYDSAKDRAENLMIVDLMRNDLSRVAVPGSVAVEQLFEIESYPTVHHLVSTVTGTALEGATAADLLEATFPPGSITGAPKHQAMKVIAAHELPRGPWCGSLFHIDEDEALTASVLIRTASFTRQAKVWQFRTLAGAGIVADSHPQAELNETEAKIRALKDALIGQQLEQSTLSTTRGRR
jgi:para-aminobenzoate synthetase component 1